MIDTALPLNSLAAMARPGLNKPAATGTSADIQDAAKKFESQFIGHLVGIMFEGIETDGPFGGGQGEEMMRSFLVDEYANKIVSQGGFGLADKVARELLALQEGGK